jgi:hypothetical protein
LPEPDSPVMMTSCIIGCWFPNQMLAVGRSRTARSSADAAC